MMTWDETDLTEFFGAPAGYDEDGDMFTFAAAKDGVRVEFSLVPCCGDTYLSLWLEGRRTPLVDIQRKGCSHVQVVTAADGKRCLEVGRTRQPVTDMGIAPILHRGVRVRLDPQVSFELIEQDETAA